MTTIAPASTLALVKARAVMAPGLVSSRPRAALTEVATLMSVRQVHAVMVDPGRLVTARDVVRAALAGAMRADEIAAAEAPSVAPEDTLLAAAERMVHADDGHVIVRDDADGHARGIVSSFDVAAVLAGHDPRIARTVRPAPARPAVSGPLAAHTVRDVMHRGVIGCAPSASLADVASVLIEHRTHTVMVSADGGMAFVTDLDLVSAAVRGGPESTAGAMASSGLAAVTADASLDRAARLVADTAVAHVVVIDDDGFPLGIVSTLDVLGAVASG